jgi:hypothetical protein
MTDGLKPEYQARLEEFRATQRILVADSVARAIKAIFDRPAGNPKK